MHHDASELARSNLVFVNWALTAYSAAASALLRSVDAPSLMQAVCDAVARNPNYCLVWIGIADPDKSVRIAAQSGVAQSYLEGISVSWDAAAPTGLGPTGISLRTGTIQILRDSELTSTFEPWKERARMFGIRSSASVPFRMPGGTGAALMVYADHPLAFSDDAIGIFKNLVDELEYGLKTLQDGARRLAAEKATEESLFAAVSSISTAMEWRDPYTKGHQDRVSKICMAIAGELGLDDQNKSGLRLAATVHDVGKISVPIEILVKPTRLSPSELSIVQDHARVGYDILKDIPFPWPVADIVHQHHEKLDGTGYPLKLSGDQILLESRILAVADIFEAISSMRPYRRALGVDAGLKYLVSEAGKTLDADIVEVCRSLVGANKLTILAD